MRKTHTIDRENTRSPFMNPLYLAIRIVWTLTSLLEALLALRFVLLLLGANPIASFTRLIYNLSQPFVAPFSNVFGVGYVEGVVFEWTTLLAMFVYWLIGWGITALLAMGINASNDERD